MQHLLYTILFFEMFIILTLLFKTPLRKLVIMTIDRVKRGHGPVIVKTIAGTVLVVFMSSVYSIIHIHHRPFDPELPAPPPLNPTDQVLLSKHQLEATLMGFMLFLSLMIDRLHHYIRELRLLRKSIEATKKQDRALADGSSAEAKALSEEIASLRAKISKLESNCKAKGNEAKTAETEAEALRKQSEKLLLEYDHLLEDNQSLRSQLESMEQTLSESDGKKNA